MREKLTPQILPGILLWVLITLLCIPGCTSFLVPPTATPTLTLTPAPTQTHTPTITPTHTLTPSQTPLPTGTPTADFLSELWEPQILNGGQFSYQPVHGYNIEYSDYGLAIADEDHAIVIMIQSFTDMDTDALIDEFSRQMLDLVMGKMAAQYQVIQSYPLKIDDKEGLAFEISGSTSNNSFMGMSVAVKQDTDRILYGLATGFEVEGEDHWNNEGKDLFNKIISSIKFIATSADACPVSTDSTYGFTQENAIKVGGDWFKGPEHERAYLDNLKGPNGEDVKYERLGSLGFGDIIQDEYQVSYNGKSVILYLDMYNFEELYAPVGFTCWGPFTITEP